MLGHLENAQAKVLGVVLNRVSRKSSQSGYHGYEGYDADS